MTNNLLKYRQGFTLVEMAVVAPVVILVIGVVISAIISLTGDSLARNAYDNLSLSLNKASETITSDTQKSVGFLATNSIALSSPSGYNNDTTAFTNVGTNGNTLILKMYATSTNPSNSDTSYIYPSSAATPLIYNIVYFIKDSTLWRRVLLPTDYATVGGTTPWQQPSCAPNVTGTMCVDKDEKIIENISSITFNYFATNAPTTAISAAISSGTSDANRQTALDNATIVKITSNASTTAAGRTIDKSASTTVHRLN